MSFTSKHLAKCEEKNNNKKLCYKLHISHHLGLLVVPLTCLEWSYHAAFTCTLLFIQNVLFHKTFHAYIHWNATLLASPPPFLVN